ncbi:MAG: HPF/RaiA family ribosome-associated protein [Rhodospirillaceae bacterium]|nr:HPF/RaiA family ribosome-associated protein [Rhodospirillaceae bacterium]
MGVGQSLRKHVENVLDEAVGKFFDHARDAHITFDKSGHAFSVDVKVHASPSRDLATLSTQDYILANEEVSGSSQTDANAAHDSRENWWWSLK